MLAVPASGSELLKKSTWAGRRPTMYIQQLNQCSIPFHQNPLHELKTSSRQNLIRLLAHGGDRSECSEVLRMS